MPQPRNAKMLPMEVDPSTLLSPDSPMVIFLTDLETAVGGGGGASSGGGNAGGGGGESGGPQDAVIYCAICERQDHESLGFTGTWIGDDRENIVAAIGDQQAHEHFEAYVVMRLGQYLIGPVTQV